MYVCVWRKNEDCVLSYRRKEVSRHAVWVQPSVRRLVEFDGPGGGFRRQFGEGAEEVARLGHALEPGVGAAFDDDQVLASLHPQLRHQLHPLRLGGDVRQGEGARHQVVLDLYVQKGQLLILLHIHIFVQMANVNFLSSCLSPRAGFVKVFNMYLPFTNPQS